MSSIVGYFAWEKNQKEELVPTKFSADRMDCNAEMKNYFANRTVVIYPLTEKEYSLSLEELSIKYPKEKTGRL